ncbi:MAG: hypothetical protein ACI4OY_05135 [Aristaeellaceae bacterium]
MKKCVAALLLAIMLCCIAAAVGDASLTALLQQYSPQAVREANAVLPEDDGLMLTEREEEIYRLGFARGYDAASAGPQEASSGSDDENLVWIPTNGGHKYHARESCSGMLDPVQVTVSEAQRQDYEPCGRCMGQ